MAAEVLGYAAADETLRQRFVGKSFKDPWQSHESAMPEHLRGTDTQNETDKIAQKISNRALLQQASIMYTAPRFRVLVT